LKKEESIAAMENAFQSEQELLKEEREIMLSAIPEIMEKLGKTEEEAKRLLLRELSARKFFDLNLLPKAHRKIGLPGNLPNNSIINLPNQLSKKKHPQPTRHQKIQLLLLDSEFVFNALNILSLFGKLFRQSLFLSII
jgi:hypothetical protein